MFGIEVNAWAPMLAGIFGVLVSGIISFLLQRQMIKHDLKTSIAREIQKENRVAKRILIKSFRMVDEIALLDRYFSKQRKFLDNKNFPEIEKNTASYVAPLGHLPDHISFSEEELASKLLVDDEKLLIDLLSMQGDYTSAINLLVTYNNEHQFYAQNMAPPDAISGEIGFKIVDNSSEGAKMDMLNEWRLVRLNSLIEGIMQRVTNLKMFSSKVHKDLGEKLVKTSCLSKDSKLL